MWQLFNLSYWAWLAENYSPAALTRAYFAGSMRIPSDTHKKND